MIDLILTIALYLATILVGLSILILITDMARILMGNTSSAMHTFYLVIGFESLKNPGKSELFIPASSFAAYIVGIALIDLAILLFILQNALSLIISPDASFIYKIVKHFYPTGDSTVIEDISVVLIWVSIGLLGWLKANLAGLYLSTIEKLFGKQPNIEGVAIDSKKLTEHHSNTASIIFDLIFDTVLLSIIAYFSASDSLSKFIALLSAAGMAVILGLYQSFPYTMFVRRLDALKLYKNSPVLIKTTLSVLLNPKKGSKKIIELTLLFKDNPMSRFLSSKVGIAINSIIGIAMAILLFCLLCIPLWGIGYILGIIFYLLAIGLAILEWKFIKDKEVSKNEQ